MAVSAREVCMAIESLTPDELLRLRGFAIWRVRGLGPRSDGKNHDDLMQEAVTRTVAGERRWNEGSVSFVTHLLGAMRSISNHWATQYTRDTPVAFSALDETTVDGRIDNPIERVPSETPGPEAQLACKEEVEAIERLFAGDAAAARVLDGLRGGLSGPAIQAATGCSKMEYETIMKRIRRRVRGAASRGESR